MKTLMILLVLIAVPSFASDEMLTAGAGRFEMQRGGKKVAIWYYLPQNLSAQTPILMLMHGVNRDAQRYRDDVVWRR
jgi:poly(3-hydroxybutyrate) depolymerase